MSETTPLLGDESAEPSPSPRTRWLWSVRTLKNMVPLLVTLLALLIVVLSVTLLAFFPARPPRNLVLMVSDGMGPASLSFARSFLQYTQKTDYSTQLPLDTALI